MIAGPPLRAARAKPSERPKITRLFQISVRIAQGFAAAAAFACASAASADEACLYRPAPTAGLASAEKVGDYRSTLLACRNGAGEGRIAIRTMTISGAPLLLLADPDKLSTSIEKRACWSCQDAGEGVANDRYLRAVERAAGMPGVERRTFFQNAGLTHGAAGGSYVTGDLCPSRRPLDRRFFEKLMSGGPNAPVALSVSGLWLLNHAEDFHWLMQKQAEGALDIVWTNHSYHHPYARGRPDDQTFMLTGGLDADYEILQTERLLIANGAVPSVFFRFPGLVSNSPLMDAVRRHHLIALGADAWLAKGQQPHDGSIILVHPNGNEEAGIDRFDRDFDHGLLARPLEPMLAAP